MTLNLPADLSEESYTDFGWQSGVSVAMTMGPPTEAASIVGLLRQECHARLKSFD